MIFLDGFEEERRQYRGTDRYGQYTNRLKIYYLSSDGYSMCFLAIKNVNSWIEGKMKMKIWDEFSEEHQHQSTKKCPYSLQNFYFWGANKVQT